MTTTSLMPKPVDKRPSPFCSSTCRHRCTWSLPPVRSTSTPGPVPRPGPINRTAGHGPAFCALRSHRIPQPGDGPGPFGGRDRHAGNPNRRWIAGLQLAAISMQDARTLPALSNLSQAATISCWTTWSKKSWKSNPKASRLSCCNGYPRPADRLLCDAVRFGGAKSPTGQEDGQTILEMLQHTNLFIVPWMRNGDGTAITICLLTCYVSGCAKPTWNRFQRYTAEPVNGTRRNGLPSDAIRHALAA